ncbi:YdeI/OmpD-associated family protein [Sphingomonas sp. BK235]|uniref:YdeI/OmpD-associated family protein n=1 Tax=Sphingomonas sp. BK235 TaxID=2512131 RepID=UPI00104B880E|nr:YdeI/OmpD-associated family protein [Sphingomonas sp. BK235]
MSLPQAEAFPFETPEDLAGWLAEHHATSRELWVRIYKDGSGQRSVTWTDCVVEAIRFGWIDGLKRSADERSYLQRLTPRRPGSNWSAKNRDHAERLIAEGRITPAGLVLIEAARAEGRWDIAYEGSATMVIPQDLLDALAARPEAKAFFQTLDRKNLYPIYYRLQTAKRPETRPRRVQHLLEQLARGERFH